MSDSTRQLGDWPAHVIARADSLIAASACPRDYSTPVVRDMIIELSGTDPKSTTHLVRFLAARLSLPDFGSTDLRAIELSIDRRLDVIAKAQRRVTLALSEPDALPEELLEFLLGLVANTSLRLLLLARPQQSEICKALAEARGLGWRNLFDQNHGALPAIALTASTARLVSNHQAGFKMAGIAGLVVACSALWFTLREGSDNQPPTPVTNIKPLSARSPHTAAANLPKPTLTASSQLMVASAKDLSQPAPAAGAQPRDDTTQDVAIVKVAEESADDAGEEGLFPAGARYTIQIASYRRADFRHEFMRQNGDRLPELRSVDVVDSGQRKMLVLYGAFNGYTAAKSAALELPEITDLRDPYVIKIASNMETPSPPQLDHGFGTGK